MIIWSDNVDEETMDLYPLSQESDFDAEFDRLYNHSYSNIDKTSYDLSVLQQ